MLKKFLLIALTLMLVASLAFAGGDKQGGGATSGGSSKAKTVSIGKVPNTLKHLVHGADSKYAKGYAKDKYGADYDAIDPDQDNAKSIAAVETFISRGVTGIILHPIQEDGVNDVIQEARNAGVYIMTYCVEASGKKVPHLGIDEASVAQEMGADMCKKWISLYPNKPIKIGLVSWTNINFCFDNRTGPFLKGANSVVNYLPKTDNWNYKTSAGEVLHGATYWEHAGGVREKAIEVTSAAIIKYPDVNIIYGDNDANGLGVAAAYEAAGRGKAKDGVPLTEIIASTDASEPELKKITDPTSSLKYCLGMAPKTFATAEIDRMMSIINKQVDNDKYVLWTTPDAYFNYYKDSVASLEEWYNSQYLPDTPLKLR
jgi:ABC-type sugar transport system substrate-binding protein